LFVFLCHLLGCWGVRHRHSLEGSFHTLSFSSCCGASLPFVFFCFTSSLRCCILGISDEAEQEALLHAEEEAVVLVLLLAEAGAAEVVPVLLPAEAEAADVLLPGLVSLQVEEAAVQQKLHGASEEA